MRALRLAVIAQLRGAQVLSEQGLVSTGGDGTASLHYWLAPIDTELPYAEFWLGDGIRDFQAGFGEEGREYTVYVQAKSRLEEEASVIYEALEGALRYVRFAVEGWILRGPIVWQHQLDDPGDLTQDNKPVYYEGGAFKVELHRPRVN